MHQFYLGTHLIDWLGSATVPLFVSLRRFERIWAKGPNRHAPRAVVEWCGDSGGFTMLSQYGTWPDDETAFVDKVRRAVDESGRPHWFAPQDWMCEPGIIAGDARRGWPGTGKSVAEHQRLTVYNFVTLRMVAADLPFVPVLQGWDADDYLRCADLYERHGVTLSDYPAVLVGSVCRRQAMGEAERILWRIRQAGIGRLHGLGFKMEGVERCHDLLASSDSLAWSYWARRSKTGPMMPECQHAKCSHCRRWAMEWRRRLLSRIGTGTGDSGGLFRLQAGPDFCA